jgi:hypothetical protein
MRTLALPKEVKHWSLTTLREKLVKIGAKVVRHGRYINFQMAEAADNRQIDPHSTQFSPVIEIVSPPQLSGEQILVI